MFFSDYKKVRFNLIASTDDGTIWHGETDKLHLDPQDIQIKTKCNINHNLSGHQLRSLTYFYFVVRNHKSITIQEVVGAVIDSPFNDESRLIMGVNDRKILNENVPLDKWFYDVLGLSVEWSSF